MNDIDYKINEIWGENSEKIYRAFQTVFRPIERLCYFCIKDKKDYIYF